MRAIPRPDRRLLGTTSAVLLVVFSCLLSTARIIRQAPVPTRLEADPVARRSDERFAEITASLPARGTIGYIGVDGLEGTADYYLAQYALAPRVIDRSPNHRVVIGNFPQTSAKNFPPGLTIVKDFGNGVLLFSNKDAE